MLPAAQAKSESSRELAISLLVDEFKAAVESIPEPIMLMNQDELESERKPTDIDYLLRKKLWILVDNAQKGLVSEIASQDVFRGTCSRQLFHLALKNPNRVAWLLTPPIHDQDLMEAGVKIGLRNLIKFVSKEPNSETASAFLKAMEILLNRTHGPVIQRVDARHAHMNLNKPLAPQNPDPNSRLEELKQKLMAPKDVTPEEIK
jgi:hypothetical protein